MVCTGTRSSPAEYVRIYECVLTLCDVRITYLGKYMYLFIVVVVVAVVVVFTLNHSFYPTTTPPASAHSPAHSP